MRISYLNTFTFVHVIVFIIFILVISKFYKESKELLGNFKWVSHTYTVLNSLELTESRISDMETNTLAFYQTNSPPFHNSFIQDTIAIYNTVSKIHTITKDNPTQQGNLDQLDSLLAQRISELVTFIQYRKHHGINKETIEKEAEKIRSDSTNVAIINLLKHMKGLEGSLLTEREAKATVKVTQIQYLFIAIAIGTFVIGLIFLFEVRRDLRQKRKIQEGLRSLDRNKNLFFSIISHDLRGPINSAHKLAEFLNGDTNEIDRVKMAEMLRHSIKKVATLLDELLEWARLQMNKIDFNPQVIDLCEIVDEVIESLNGMIKDKGIIITNKINNCKAYGDHYMTSTIIRNLLTNAIKFSMENKSIHVSGQLLENGLLEVKVTDEGIGMNEDARNKLFRLDVRQTTKGTKQESGSGLGLIICKEFVEKQGGKIWATSVVGNGSSFCFTLPSRK
ncbi:ATP-binding protein [Sporocytophaga myxococcoides]|uniref:sensor histidine kinase n=1 Tax=Sporocytophaga myxococcoides TaxID=153721 RepID=UPI000420DF79|nr:ATP-binding protein [Sporocytophaga myxococcoides]